ncbi:hypothetical protein GF420_03925 [candidate division GN15 bacterium]|nr:hypothetical protein [candidate division GN15 bacterium]
MSSDNNEVRSIVHNQSVRPYGSAPASEHSAVEQAPHATGGLYMNYLDQNRNITPEK